MIPIRAVTAAAVIVALTTFSADLGRGDAPRGDADALAHAERAQIEAIVKDYLAQHPEEVQRIVKDYLVKNPEVLQEALTELIKRRAPPDVDKTAVIQENAAALFNSTRQVTLGNRQGDVTMVEFVDYNCGFCKRALGDMLELIKVDPKLKVVLKEYPVLGAGSVEAARVAIAVRMQDDTGARYLAFHRKLLSAPGPANKVHALAMAGEVGLDVARLEADMASEEVNATLTESTNLARALGIRGTPSYVIADSVLFGAVGLSVLKERIAAARKK